MFQIQVKMLNRDILNRKGKTLIIFFILLQICDTDSYLLIRSHPKAASRNIIPPSEAQGGNEHDTIVLDNFLRNYLSGPVDGYFTYFTHDVISAYVGPAPIGHPNLTSDGIATGRIRQWAMFDSKHGYVCELNAVHDWGTLALFTCPKEGVYQAFAYESNLNSVPLPQPAILDSYEGPRVPLLVWLTRRQKEQFDLMKGPTKGPNRIQLFEETHDYRTPSERINHIVEQAKTSVVKSDPALVKASYFCYQWLYELKEIARQGYDDVVGPGSIAFGTAGAHIDYELLIWVAEASAVLSRETGVYDQAPKISDYSRLITQRFSDTGLFPCLRWAHAAIQIVSEIIYVFPADPENTLDRAPYWRAHIRVHTGRIISTLSDVSFTIASRQYSGSMHCFVADTRVFVNLRDYQFVPHDRLVDGSINLKFSSIQQFFDKEKQLENQVKHIYGHGVQYIGYSWSKHYQPGTSRTDMVVINNPCHAQEFAFSVGGSLYIAGGFLKEGMKEAKEVYLPGFKNPDGVASDPITAREYITITDVVFTPTHVVFLHSDGNVLLHSPSAKERGLGEITGVRKFRPHAFVNRRWCPNTETQKYSVMKIPIFGRSGSIIILQLYPIEGNVRMWITDPPASCKGEGIGFVGRARDQEEVLNETDIHYDEYIKVKRTNHKTGLAEPPLEPKEPPPEASKSLEPEKEIDLDEKFTFLISDPSRGDTKVDPHYPLELIDPATHTIGDGEQLENYNEAVIYVLVRHTDHHKLTEIVKENGLDIPKTGFELYAVEFAAEEHQYIVAFGLQSPVIKQAFEKGGEGNTPFEMIITSITVTNYPFRVQTSKSHRDQDEVKDITVPFPGTIIMRSKWHRETATKSRDPIEEADHNKELIGGQERRFIPKIYPLSTSFPSYVIDFGDVLLYTSEDGRFARPLHYYKWEVTNAKIRDQRRRNPPLVFNDSTLIFKKPNRLHDVLVTEKGIISVLWRKPKRHLVQDDPDCLRTEDSVGQTVAAGSFLLEGLRELKPFFRNDNIFQRATPDGEIMYGVYETAPHSHFRSCGSRDEKDDFEPCIEQPKGSEEETMKFCAKGVEPPCLDPGLLPHCSNETTFAGIPCIRFNETLCPGTRYEEDFDRPTAASSSTDKCPKLESTITPCIPAHSPREAARSVNLLGTSFLSTLLGSLETVESLHPEAPVPESAQYTESPADTSQPYEESADESGCPFASFVVYSKDFDFAEVNYQLRITGEISYFGTVIPTEADLLVEYEKYMGVVTDISSSVEEERGLTTIRKTIDISFEMTDFTLSEMMEPTSHSSQLDFDDLRATEKSTSYSITLRPSILNAKCRNSDYFKTIQFNVGCNAFTRIRLISEASPLKRINWTAALDESNQFRWHIDKEKKNLSIPVEHVFFRQVVKKVFECSNGTNYCAIPYMHLFKNEIFTISYRDFFLPSFEQFMTVTSRKVTGNVVLYDMLGSMEFNLTLNLLKAGCYGVANNWYERLLNSTKNIGTSALEHEDIYNYYEDCFDKLIHKDQRELPAQLHSMAFHLHNGTNENEIKFRRNRNQIFIFRAAVLNTYYNRFTYCKLLDTYFMVRVVGIPIPRQKLALWHYLCISLCVCVAFLGSYYFFYRFYTWKLELGGATTAT